MFTQKMLKIRCKRTTRFRINVSVFACQSTLKGSLFPTITHYGAQKAPCHPPSWNVMHAIRRDCSRSWGAGSGAGTGGWVYGKEPEESVRGGENKGRGGGDLQENRRGEETNAQPSHNLTPLNHSCFPLAVINTHQ